MSTATERLLSAAARALERVEVGDCEEAEAILKEVVRLDGSYVDVDRSATTHIDVEGLTIAELGRVARGAGAPAGSRPLGSRPAAIAELERRARNREL